MVIGLFLFSTGIILTIRANIGASPWDVFHLGIINKTGLTLGFVTALVGVLIVIIVTILKEKFGLGTIFNIILIGLFLDLILWLDVIPTALNPVFGTIMLLSGLFTIAIGTYFYIKSGFGAGPRDSLMVVITRKTKLPVGLCRGVMELFVTIIGWILGGKVGFGTVISVIAIGFCIQIVFKIFKFDVTSVKHETLKETLANLRRP